jgi:hypothetical protein
MKLITLEGKNTPRPQFLPSKSEVCPIVGQTILAAAVF